ncbi:MAG TPA: protein kinase [Gemmatimonadaceae bacterium]|nr:protein kinase [Gemmatimonadaceae bacterium]
MISERTVPEPLRDALAERYVIERELGAGGMATVYLAHDVRHERPVAIKVFRPAVGASFGTERFGREIKLLARLRHPFILPLLDSGETAGALYFVMPYVDGESLRSRLTREGRLPVEEAVELARSVADALAYAHSEGVVHRDVKPENVLLSRQGHAVLADFGIARGRSTSGGAAGHLTEDGLALGTTVYMSPEQALGEPDVDGRSDIYSLGITLYEMLAGRPPFSGPNAIAIISQHLTVQPTALSAARADVPPAVEQAVSRALAKERAARFAAASDFARALRVGSASPNPEVRQEAAERTSIAVLPFGNLSADKENEYFSDGITEELIGLLAKVSGLRVVSRSSAFAFKGKNASAREIGATLDVRFLLEGSVRRAGSRLRVTAQLIRVSDDSPLWSETYDRQIEDIFAVQDDISARIVETITRTLPVGHLSGLQQVRQPRSLEAYNLCLLGRYHWNKRDQASLRQALDLFGQAAEIDPTYAPAHSGIADACALLASYAHAPPTEMYPRAAAAAAQAIALDESLAEGHASLGFAKYNWEWDWEGAERELRRAIALNPSYATAHQWLAMFLAGLGRADEALPIARRAIDLDPLSVNANMALGAAFQFGGRLDEAVRQFRRVVAMQPGFALASVWLCATHAIMGQGEESLAVAERMLQSMGEVRLVRACLAMAYAASGRTAEARQIQADLASSPMPLFQHAMIHAIIGDDATAFDWLERAFIARTDMYTLRVHPAFARMRAQPRFVRLLERLGLS